jgi:hypothetical protein
MADEDTSGAPNYGFWAVIGGLAVLVIIGGVAIGRYSAAADAAGLIGAAGAVVGTVVGAFFGVHAGSAASQQAQAAANDQHQAAVAQATQAQQDAMRSALRAAIAIQPGTPEAKEFLDNLPK